MMKEMRRLFAHVFRPEGRGAKLTADDLLYGGDVVPGWTLPLRELFE